MIHGFFDSSCAIVVGESIKFVLGTFRERDALNAMLIMMKCHEIKRVVKNYTAIECTGCYGQYSFGR